MSPFMNMTLFSALPGSERLSLSLFLARSPLAVARRGADNRIHNDGGVAVAQGERKQCVVFFLFCGGPQSAH